MIDRIESTLVAPALAPSQGIVPPTQATPTKPSAFHEVLSELNPLQYIPVVGMIYRAVTGDTISEPARQVGGLVVSGLMGGPVGMLMNVAMLAAEKVTGIDPETIGQHVLASIGIGTETAGTTAVAASQPPATLPTTTVAAASPAFTGWSAAQMSAYGVTTSAEGTLRRGDLAGSDVLNDMELARHGAQFAATPAAVSQPAAS